MEKSEVMENKGYSRMIVFMILKTFLVVMVLVAAGVVSYFVTLKYYEIADEKNGKDAVLDIVGDVLQMRYHVILYILLIMIREKLRL